MHQAEVTSYNDNRQPWNTVSGSAFERVLVVVVVVVVVASVKSFASQLRPHTTHVHRIRVARPKDSKTKQRTYWDQTNVASMPFKQADYDYTRN